MLKYFALIPAVMGKLVELGVEMDAAGAAACEADENSAECISARAFTGSIGKTIRSINEYGCWCYFGDDHGRGKGQPQDAIDEMCKVLADGYECAMRDAEDEGTTCVPWEVEYTSAIGGSDVGIAGECAQNNPDSNCAARACTIEGAFIANLLDALSPATVSTTPSSTRTASTSPLSVPPRRTAAAPPTRPAAALTPIGSPSRPSAVTGSAAVTGPLTA